MNSKQKTVLTNLILITLNVCWLIFYDNFILIPISLIVVGLINLRKINKTQKLFIQMSDNAESIDDKIDIKLPITFYDLKISETNAILYFDKIKEYSIPSNILKINFKNKKLTTKTSRKREFNEIEYFVLMITQTIKTKINIITLSYRTKNDLKEIYFFACPRDLKMNEAIDFFERFLKIIGQKSNIETRLINR
jgi:hypothetical protein